VPEHDLVDVAGVDPGIGQCPLRNPYDQTFERLAFEAAEGSMGPTHDTSGHGGLLSILVRFQAVPIAETELLRPNRNICRSAPPNRRILDAFF
jgi:hypothetical protein